MNWFFWRKPQLKPKSQHVWRLNFVDYHNTMAYGGIDNILRNNKLILHEKVSDNLYIIITEPL